MNTPSHSPDLATGGTLHAADAELGVAPTMASAGRLPLLELSTADSGARPRRDDLAASAQAQDPSFAALARASTMGSGERAHEPEDGADDTQDGARRRAAASTLPRRLGRYHILERLGAGGMGIVFTAYDPDLDRKVAVKLLYGERSGPDSQVRLLREAQALARLSHPNVVQIHDASVVGAQVFIAMEFVRGQDLRTWLMGQQRQDHEILRVFLDAGRGLAAAHAEGLVHRDFKPENVLVGADGRVRVADFGLARAGLDDGPAVAPAPAARPSRSPLDVSLTATGALLGTPAYMSPEQHCGARADARSDQFSFCVALWEALYRQRPFAGDSLAALVVAVQSGELRLPPSDTGASRRLAGVLRRGLMPRPEQRYPDMNALLAALERDPARARRRWAAGAALFALSTGTAYAAAEYRAAEANACSGVEAGLAGAWDPARRVAVAGALELADPARAARVLAGLDGYAARWSASRRGACLDHRRGELPEAVFDARVRCLERRRLALGSAAAVLATGAPDPAQLVARLPTLRACDDPDAARSETSVPEDPTLARAVGELDARLIEARARYHASDLEGALTGAQAVTAEARRLDLRPLLAEALLLLGQIHEGVKDPILGGEHVAEAVVHALATRRDDLAAEALARQIYFEGQRVELDRARANAPLARALAERLPEPAAALARLENNLGTLHLIERDLDAARPYFERAVAAVERVPDADPIERANYWNNLAVATREPGARDQAFARASAAIAGALGDDHLLAAELGLYRGMLASDARSGAERLDALCPRYLSAHAEAFGSCAYCFYHLGQMHAALGERAPALAAFSRVEVCLQRDPAGIGGTDHLAALGGRAAAFAALLQDRPAAALEHADAALARNEAHRSRWWVQAERAELELARGKALLAMERGDEGRAALARALPVFEDMTRTRVQVLDPIWLAGARAALGPADP